jgi:hypothetical protein
MEAAEIKVTMISIAEMHRSLFHMLATLRHSIHIRAGPETYKTKHIHQTKLLP